MKLADVSIDRPVFATMMIFALVVLGFSWLADALEGAIAGERSGG